jgi:hypothetical protein
MRRIAACGVFHFGLLEEGEMKKLISIYWQIRIVLFALRWMPGLNLGDHVMYQGRTWYLAQGVCRPRWTLRALDRSEDVEVNESEFQKVRSLSNYWRSFKFGHSFYMAYWHDIWVHKGIQTWMRSCRIWGGA